MAAELEMAAHSGPAPAKPRQQRSQVGHELKRLRREAEYLAIRLTYLQSGSDETSETAPGRTGWTEAELEEYGRFLQAKRTNRKLRALVAKQQVDLLRLSAGSFALLIGSVYVNRKWLLRSSASE